MNMLIELINRGEIPKRLKGLPWKGSRSLIAARGFKSLFLRPSYLGESIRITIKKKWTSNWRYDKMLKLLIFLIEYTIKKKDKKIKTMLDNREWTW